MTAFGLFLSRNAHKMLNYDEIGVNISFSIEGEMPSPYRHDTTAPFIAIRSYPTSL